MALSKRERVLVAIPTAVLLTILISEPIAAFADYLSQADLSLATRKLELQKVQQVTRRYRTLSDRLDTLRASYAEKALSLEEVYSKLDQIVKDSIGGDNYELKRKDVGQSDLEYEQHHFQLTVNTLTLDELVKLLFALEQGEEPLFLKKVSLLSKAQGKFQATILLYSIQSNES
jgi:hypothetical protein